MIVSKQVFKNDWTDKSILDCMLGRMIDGVSLVGCKETPEGKTTVVAVVIEGGDVHDGDGSMRGGRDGKVRSMEKWRLSAFWVSAPLNAPAVYRTRNRRVIRTSAIIGTM